MLTMRDTLRMMISDDYKERFVAEYWQLKNRYDRLHEMVVKYEADVLEFRPDCPLGLLKNQEWSMSHYLHALEVRAQIEKIPLDLPKQDYPSNAPGAGFPIFRCDHSNTVETMNNCTCEK